MDRTKVIAVLGGIVAAMLVIAVSFALRTHGILPGDESVSPGTEGENEAGTDAAGSEEAELVEVQWKGNKQVQQEQKSEKPPAASDKDSEKKPETENETD